MLSKNVNNKKCASELIFLNEKKMRKILLIFDIEKSQIKALLDTFPILKIIFFGYLSNFVPPA